MTPSDADLEAAIRAINEPGRLREAQDLVARAAPTLQRVLLVSSSAVYGEHGGDWVDESTTPAPPGFNGQVLLEAEQLLAAQPITSIALRLAGLYGPGRLQLLERLRTGEVRVPRALPHWANRIHIDDAAAAIVHLLELADPLPGFQRGNAVERGQHPPPLRGEDRTDLREDQVKMEADNRHEYRKRRKRVNQYRLHDDLGPVVSPHVGADRHDAEPEKEPR